MTGQHVDRMAANGSTDHDDVRTLVSSVAHEAFTEHGDGELMSAEARELPPAWNGEQLLDALRSGAKWLLRHRDRVNALNVFPVPDGDTGTNMSLTFRSAIEEAEALTSAERVSAGTVAGKVAYGSLMGARGNSGVILSQIFRGLSLGIEDKATVDGQAMAQAFVAAKDMAYKAVMRPVEGTMLTVIRVASDHARHRADQGDASVREVLAAALAGAEESLARTPEQLDILRQAGVVDSGGQGIVFLLEGMYRFAIGEAIPESTGEQDISLDTAVEMAFLDEIDTLHEGDVFGYCTNFLVTGEAIDVEAARVVLIEMGDSAVIVGDNQHLKVHIHALNPGQVLDYAVRLGDLTEIKIDNMQAQTRDLQRQRDLSSNSRSRSHAAPPRVGVEPEESDPSSVSIGTQEVLAVAAGDGLAKALRSMGATGVISGGQTMNPSTQDLLSAVNAASSDDVILLPNNGNILMTANQIPDLAERNVRVVGSRSIPQGLAALAAFNGDADLDQNVRAMESAMGYVTTVEITRAVRDATVNDVKCYVGQLIGVVDDVLVAASDDILTLVRATLERTDISEAELITIFVGDEPDAEETDCLRDVVASVASEAEIEVYQGGQPHYRYVLSVE